MRAEHNSARLLWRNRSNDVTLRMNKRAIFLNTFASSKDYIESLQKRLIGFLGGVFPVHSIQALYTTTRVITLTRLIPNTCSKGLQT